MARAALLVPLLPLLLQDPKKPEYRLGWNLAHDSAAIYDVHELPSKSRRGEFWLLGCEWTGRVGATDTRDLPWRFLMRAPKDPVRVGSTWQVREFAFGDLPVYGPNVAPVEVVGAYRLKEVRKAALVDLIKSAPKDRSAAEEVAVVEGQFQVFRRGWLNEKVVEREKQPSATLATFSVVRTRDGAIIGGRFSWQGRTETYWNFSSPTVAKGEHSAECVLREPLVRLEKKELKSRIDSAIENGVRWLKGQANKDGRIMDDGGYAVGTAAGTGSTALALSALLHSGVKPDDPVIRAGFGYIAAMNTKLIQVYDLALYLTALESKYLPMGWVEEVEAFTEDKAREEIARRITPEDKAAAERAAHLLVERQAKNGAFGYQDPGYPNMSSLQYALLGLKSASRMGVRIPSSVWTRALSYIDSATVSYTEEEVRIVRRGGAVEERKETVCGWGYLEPAYRWPTGTMTLAALAIIAVCRSELERTDSWSEGRSKQLVRLEWGGFGWMKRWYGVRAGTPEGCGYGAAMPFYYLYGLERALILQSVERIADHDWYHEGAAILLSWQYPNGKWNGPHNTPIIDTAWALLFLKRATIPITTGKNP